MTEGVWEAPGRVNVIGEHTDYNGGFALPIASPQRARCRARARYDGTVTVASRQYPNEPVTVRVQDLGEAEVPQWSRYVLGVVWELVRRGFDVGGADLAIDSDVPQGAGLSSSAAVECAVAVAFRDLGDLAVSDDELVSVTSRAENDYVGAPTGTLDQSASLLCRPGHALFLDFGTGERLHVPFDLGDLELLVVDTRTSHSHASGGYAERRAQCEEAAARLGLRTLRDASGVQALNRLDNVVRRRARHVITENDRVTQVVDLLRDGGDVRAVGPILTASHRSLRDDFAVSTPELDDAVDAALAGGALGARLVGGGFGGSIIVLTEGGSVGAVETAVAARFAGAGHAAPRVTRVRPGSGARRIG